MENLPNPLTQFLWFNNGLSAIWTATLSLQNPTNTDALHGIATNYMIWGRYLCGNLNINNAGSGWKRYILSSWMVLQCVARSGELGINNGLLLWGCDEVPPKGIAMGGCFKLSHPQIPPWFSKHLHSWQIWLSKYDIFLQTMLRSKNNATFFSLRLGSARSWFKVSSD